MPDRIFSRALDQLVTVVRAPATALSGADGQLRGHGAHGFYQHDRRVLCRLELTVGGVQPYPVGHAMHGADSAEFHGLLAGLDLQLRRDRSLTGDGLVERCTVANLSGEPVELAVALAASTDLAPVHDVGTNPTSLVDPAVLDSGAVSWTDDGCHVRLSCEPAPHGTGVRSGAAHLSWAIALDTRERWELIVRVSSTEERAGGFLATRPDQPPRWTPPPEPDRRLRLLLERSLADLDGLVLCDHELPDAPFLAAGTPWFLTLFGRDSLWSARFLLPLGTELADGTLRTLASRQGRADDPATEEQPGKIPHELRRRAIVTPQLHLPPQYYGTIDATALWVCLLHEAWHTGLAEERIRPLLPHLTAALDWITGPSADPDGDGFCEYIGSAGKGLANQGWKDSADGVRWADGRLAARPLALCEVQGYAHAAAVGGAELLDAFGAAGGERLRDWAAALRERFRAAFWLDDEHGRYPAIALDGDKRPVDGPASNMAHLLGTGLVNTSEAAEIAAMLARSELHSGYGLRTLSSRSAAFNPLSYHCGSVWPHDTAIAVLGLAAEGHHDVARSLALGVLDAAEYFDYQLPELYGGTSATDGEPPTTYPPACRPQAWAAAGAVAVANYLADRSHPMIDVCNAKSA